MIELGSAVGKILLDLTDFEGSLKKAKNDLKVFSDDTASVSDKMVGLGSAMSGVGKVLTVGVTTPLVGVGAMATKTSQEFKVALNQVISSTGAGAAEAKKFEEVMRDIYTNNYGESYEDIANSIASVRQQMGDLNSQELQEVTESAITFRDTFGVEVPESIRAASTLIEQFGIDSEEAFDLMTYGMQNGLDFSGEFIDSINEYSVQFKKAGFDAEDMFAAFVNGAENGAFNLDKIGDAVKEFSIRMVDGSDTTSNALKDLGLNADEVISKFAEGGESANSVFNDIITRLEEIPDKVKQNEVGVGLFGTMWEDLGATAVLSLNDIEGSLGEVQGSMDELKNTKYDDLGSMFETLKRNLEDFALSIGNVLMPMIEPFIQGLTDMARSLSEMDPAFQQTIVIVGLLAAAMGPILSTIGTLLTSLPAISTALGAVGTSIGALAAPIGIVIAAVAALAAAWATDFGGIREKTQEIMDSISEIISTVMQAITTAWETDFLGIQTITTTVWEAIQEIVSQALDILVGFVDAFSALLQGDWTGLWEAIKGIAQSAWDLICSLVGNALGLVISLIANAAIGFFTAAADLFQGLYDAWINLWDNTLKPIIFSTPEELFSMLKDGAHWLFDAGVSLFTSLWDGLKSVFENIKNWVTDSLNWVLGRADEAKSVAADVDRASGIRGPSSGSGPSGSYATGLDYVPRDMTIQVHEGERILTKEENLKGSSTPAVINVKITFTQPVDENTAKRVSRQIARDTESALRSKGVVLV